jgi:hypothetical protein
VLRSIGAVLVGLVMSGMLTLVAIEGVLQPLQRLTGTPPEDWEEAFYFGAVTFGLFAGSVLSGGLARPGLMSALAHAPGVYVFLVLSQVTMIGRMQELVDLASPLWVIGSVLGVLVGRKLPPQTA